MHTEYAYMPQAYMYMYSYFYYDVTADLTMHMRMAAWWRAKQERVHASYRIYIRGVDV